MIRLLAINEQGEAAIVASAPYFRITGATVSIGPGHVGENPPVRLVSGQWQFASSLWVGLRFEGDCRLVFGLPREPSAVSDVLHGISICDGALSASGIPFAQYDEEHEMWKGLTANTWWHAFRVESVEQRDSSVTSDEERVAFEKPAGTPGVGETRPSLQ